MQKCSRSSIPVKQARSLQQRKVRQTSGLFLVEGIHAIGQAVDSATIIESLFFSPQLLKNSYAQELLEQQARNGIPCYEVDAPTFQTIAEKDNPQGLLAVVRRKDYQLSALNPNNFSCGVALIAPQDPGNIGTILRTVDAVAASGIIMTQPCVDIGHPTLVRASMGVIFWQPLISTTFDDFINWASTHCYHIYGTSAHAKQSYLEIIHYPKPLILLLGSEREGLSPMQTAVCEVLINLPMLGKTTSLNLSVAAGVLLYDVLSKNSPL